MATIRSDRWRLTAADRVLEILRRGPATVVQMHARSPFGLDAIRSAVQRMARAGVIVGTSTPGVRGDRGQEREWRLP